MYLKISCLVQFFHFLSVIFKYPFWWCSLFVLNIFCLFLPNVLRFWCQHILGSYAEPNRWTWRATMNTKWYDGWEELTKTLCCKKIQVWKKVIRPNIPRPSGRNREARILFKWVHFGVFSTSWFAPPALSSQGVQLTSFGLDSQGALELTFFGWKKRDVTHGGPTDLIRSKNVTWLTGGPNRPHLIQKTWRDSRGGTNCQLTF